MSIVIVICDGFCDGIETVNRLTLKSSNFQMSVQQIFRTLAFMAETIVFAYLGLAIFSFKHRTEPALIGWVLVLCLVGRAVNIFPLSFLLNYFREIKITKKNQVVMWFSGLRGAIAFALVLHMDGISEETSQVLVTTTLIVVLCSIIFLGGLTLPFMKFITWFTNCSDNGSDSEDELYVSPMIRKMRNRRLVRSTNIARPQSIVNGGSTTCLINETTTLKRSRRTSQSSTHEVFISKTKELGDALESENNMSGYYDTEVELFDSRNRQKLSRRKQEIKVKDPEKISHLDNDVTAMGKVAPSLRGFMRLDAKFFYPFFTRCHSEKEVIEARKSMNNLTEQWSKIVRTTKFDEAESSTVNNSPLNEKGEDNKMVE